MEVSGYIDQVIIVTASLSLAHSVLDDHSSSVIEVLIQGCRDRRDLRGGYASWQRKKGGSWRIAPIHRRHSNFMIPVFNVCIIENDIDALLYTDRKTELQQELI